MRFNIFLLLYLQTINLEHLLWKIIVKLSQDLEQSKRFLNRGISGDHFYRLQSEPLPDFHTITLSVVLQELVRLQVVPISVHYGVECWAFL